MKRRFKINGATADAGGWGQDVPGYVDADDADEASRIAGQWYDPVTECREVPWDEGRGVLWRLWRRWFKR